MGNPTQSSAQAPEVDLLQLLKEECLLASDASYVIQAGYFESAPDRLSKQSLVRGLSLKRDLETHTSKAVAVYTLHNDIGVSCEKTCAPNSEPNGREPLAWEVPIIREKTALNRGLRFLRKELKKTSPRLVTESAGTETRVCLCTADVERIPLAVQRNGNLVALCPLILASFYEMLIRQAGNDSVLVDFCHYDEVQRTRLAVQVLKSLFLPPERLPRAVVAAATDIRGNNLTPIFFCARNEEHDLPGLPSFHTGRAAGARDPP